MPEPDPAPPAAADRRELLDSALEDLGHRLDALGEERSRRCGRRVAVADQLPLTAWDLGAPCPARLALDRSATDGPDGYVESAGRAARRLGRAALRRWRPGTALGAAVAAALEDRDDWAPGLRDWFEALDRSGRSAVQAAAVTWAAGALVAVGGRGGRDDGVRWVERREWAEVPGRSIRLGPDRDAELGPRSALRAVLVVRPGAPGPGDDLVAGVEALAAGVHPRRVPERVAIAHPGTGTRRTITVDAPLLAATVERIVDVVGQLADGPAAPTRPGRWCRWCAWSTDCPDALPGPSASPAAPAGVTTAVRLTR